MRNYSQAIDHTFRKVRLNIRGTEYAGRGFMTWEADEGFRIEILLDGNIVLPKESGIIKPIDVVRKRDYCLLRMQLLSGVNAYTQIYVGNSLGLFMDNRISRSVSRVTFYEPLAKIAQKPTDVWSGHTLLRTLEKIHLPDNVYAETSINERVINKNFSIGGLDYKDDRIQFVGRMLDDQHLEMHWSLSKKYFDKATSRRWAEAVQYALSILTLQVIQPLRRVTRIGSKEKVEIIKKEDAEFISLKGGGRVSISHDELIKFTCFLASDSIHVPTCHHIFHQIVEADRQKTWTATELLISTILEAALRTIYNYPFIPGNRTPFPRRECMTRFRDEFWTPAWEDPCNRALEIFERFRHRNAHPDWLTAQQGGISDEERARSLEEMRFLCWFYRHMVLGLAGFKDTKQLFPDF